ncbi:MAG: hypothetical protein JO044_16470 [Mycobacteriaceae bacterium]|nr:hypothetical protein [Mycobacteriaceae bacterium]MBV9638798.1 hypothetical protein [Mycobacteriaceae bacterium]
MTATAPSARGPPGLSSMGYTAIAATVIGDKAAQANCKAIRQQDLPAGIGPWSTSQLSGQNSVFSAVISRRSTR